MYMCATRFQYVPSKTIGHDNRGRLDNDQASRPNHFNDALYATVVGFEYPTPSD